MASGGSRLAVFAAFTANLLIAVAKFVAASLTGSVAMLSEAWHSVADTGNQGLLLWGMKAAHRPADPRHPRRVIPAAKNTFPEACEPTE